MARDYKHRAELPKQGAKKPRKPKVTKARKPASRSAARTPENRGSIPVWRWFLVLSLLALFAYFLYNLSASKKSKQPLPVATTKAAKQKTKTLDVKKIPKKIKSAVKPESSKKVKAKTEEIFDFYTILPKKEFALPEHEVKTRKREERLGKEKIGVKYSVQAGSFRHYKDADSLKARLLLMGFSPNIEQATVGSATWYRVKMGPYKRLASVDAIQTRLKENHMDAMVVEVRN